jgi:hypothetical protein
MIGIVIMQMYFLVKYRERPTIKYSSNNFTLIFLLGSIICVFSVVFKSGNVFFRPCGLDVWILGYGFALVVGALTLKMWRLVHVTSNSKLSRSVQMTDKALMNYLLGMLAGQTGLLILWQVLDQPMYVNNPKTLLGTTISYTETICTTQSNSVGLVGTAINAISLLNVVRLAVMGRNIPSKFNDGKLMGIIVYTLTFILTITIGTSAFITDTQAVYTLQSSAILLCVFCCTVIYTGPKIYGAIMNHSVNGRSGTDLVQSSNNDFQCIHCGKYQKVALAGSTTKSIPE